MRKGQSAGRAWALESDCLGSHTGCPWTSASSFAKWNNNSKVSPGPGCSSWLWIPAISCSCPWLEQEPGCENRLLSPKLPLDSKVRTDALSSADKGRVQDEGGWRGGEKRKKERERL